MKKMISRRNFLKAAGICAAGMGLAACGSVSAQHEIRPPRRRKTREPRRLRRRIPETSLVRSTHGLPHHQA